MANMFEEAARLHDRNEAFAVAVIISQSGSTPRSTAKMIIRKDGSISGTIGGGLMEAFVMKEALEAIREGRSRVVEYLLNSDSPEGIQMQCGGRLSIFIEVDGDRPVIMMVGAGHVGRAVARLVEFLDYRLCIVDDRLEFANPESYPMASQICFDPEIAKAIGQAEIDENTYIIIATKDSDMTALRRVIDSNAAYIGMIGSRRKVRQVFGQLETEGVPPERLSFVHAPLGLDIGAETPEEIAVSALSEIMKVRNKKTGLSLRESANKADAEKQTMELQENK